MHTSKSSTGGKFFSNRNDPQSVRATSQKAMTLENLSTESQQERIKKIMSDVRKGGALSPNSVIISQSDLIRMKNSASYVSQEEKLHHKKILEEQNEQKQAAAKAKKQRMKEIEAERKKNMPQSEGEKEAGATNEALFARAKQLINEDKDEVKHMNKMMLYAKVVTIRDRQLGEKKEIEDNRKVEEKRKDLLMEVDRLQKIKYHEEVDRLKKEEQKKAALEAIDQIKEREMIRLKEQEEREREGQEMLRHIRQLQKEEAENNIAKKRQQKALLDTIFDSNQKAITKKQEKIQEERDEEERIVRYNIEKAQKEADYQAELKRIKDEKEREIQRLREAQEKFNDRQAEIDAIRAKRASELADRLARDKERREVEQKAQMNQDMLEARKLQSLEKERRVQEQAVQDKIEFAKIIAAQKAERELELRNEQEKASRLKAHSEQIKKQVAMMEEKKKQDRREFLEEGKKIKDKLSAEKYALEIIKQQKIDELLGAGIETKYTTELARKRIAF